MSARSGLVGKKSSWPYLGPSEAIFSMDRKNPKISKILPIFPMWALAAIHPGWGNRYTKQPCTADLKPSQPFRGDSNFYEFKGQGQGQPGGAQALRASVRL